MAEVVCYSEELPVMSMAGMFLLQNSTSKFLGKETYQNLRNIPEVNEYIIGHNGDVYKHAFLPHLLLVLVLVVVGSRLLHVCLRFLKQPLIVCQVIAGILIFSFLPKPSLDYPMMSDKGFDTDNVLVDLSKARVENAIGFIGVIFNFFIVGVKMDPSTLWSTGKKKPIIIGLTSLFVSIAVTSLISVVFHNHLKPLYKKNDSYMVFMLYLFCSSYFPCVADVLTELGLLNSELGRMALSCSVTQAFAGWTFQLAFTIILQSEKGWRMGLRTFLCVLAILSVIMFVIRPYARFIVRTTTPKGRVSGPHVFMIALAVFVLAWTSDLLGVVATDAAVVMGLTLPKGPPLGTALIERVDLVASELLLPIIFIKEGHLINWEEVKKNLLLWCWVEVVLLVSFITRTAATMAAAAYCGMSLKKGFLLGLIMNFRGLVEVLTYMRFVSIDLLDETTIGMVVLSTITITGVCTPLVSIYYKPLSGRKKMGSLTVERRRSDSGFSVMACFFDDKPIPALLGFLESFSPEKLSTCVYPLHIIKLEGRAASTLISHLNSSSFVSSEQMSRAHNYFLTFGQNKTNVHVLPFTSIAPLKTMHQDACTLILERNIAFVVVPFPKINSMADVEANTAMRGLVPLVLEQAPCSVGILVYHGLTRIKMPTQNWHYHVGVLFWGGSDDREAVSIACRLAHHPQVSVQIVRFRIFSETESHQQNDNDEIRHDNAVLDKLRAGNNGKTRVRIKEVSMRNLEEAFLMIRNLGDQNYDLIIVGRKQNSSSILDDRLNEWTQFPELGVVGDMLATDFSGTSNVLVVQQHSSS